MMATLIELGVTTPYSDEGGLTAFDKLLGWSADNDARNIHGFDADDAEAIVEIIYGLADRTQLEGTENVSLHKDPDSNTPAIVAALKAHGLSTESPSQLSDAFRLGALSAAADWKPQRCAECDCEYGGADCNWIKSPSHFEERSE